MAYKCSIENCQNPASYLIEWYGVNQHGENPVVVDERQVCENFDHIVRASHHESYGGFPDGIVDIETTVIEHDSLIQRVIEEIGGKNL